MTDDEQGQRRIDEDDEAKLQRLIDEGVFDPDLPEPYRDVVRALTPNEVEAISSINKRLKQVQQVVNDSAVVFGPFTKF